MIRGVNSDSRATISDFCVHTDNIPVELSGRRKQRSVAIVAHCQDFTQKY